MPPVVVPIVGPPDTPWKVFADEAPLLVEPRAEATAAAAVHAGEELVGEYYTHPETDEEWIVVARGGRPLYLPRTAVTRVHPDNRVAGDLPIGGEKVNRWWAVPIDYEPSDLVRVPAEVSSPTTREYLLRREACDALVRLLAAARGDGLPILVNSAYRSGAYQRQIYEKYVKQSGASQRYGAPPGHSEHQLGTCIDVTEPTLKHAFSESFGTTPQGQWLEANAARFGFVRSYYPETVKQTGYISEPWHWRYWGVEKAMALRGQR